MCGGILLKLVCMHCGDAFEGKNEKFCSHGCRDSHIVSLEKRTREAVRDDPGHTAKMSRS